VPIMHSASSESVAPVQQHRASRPVVTRRADERVPRSTPSTRYLNGKYRRCVFSVDHATAYRGSSLPWERSGLTDEFTIVNAWPVAAQPRFS